jgi:hypothetical protein
MLFAKPLRNTAYKQSSTLRPGDDAPVSGQLALVYSALLSRNVYPCFIGMSVLKAGDLEVGHFTKHTLSGSCASNCS